MRVLTHVSAVCAVLAVVCARSSSSSALTLSTAAQSLFDYSMQVQDARWDDHYKFIQYQEKAGEYSTRFTAWYVAGLLQRNQGSDVENAKAAIENVLSAQMVDEHEAAWYGTFKVTLDGPVPTEDSEYWPPEIYTTYDPNWREFIGTQLIQLASLYPSLLGPSLTTRIETALEAAAVGAMRRNGTFPAGDNLTPAYSNPALMRCLVVGWIGARRGNTTLTAWADAQGTTLLDLFRNGNASSDTLGEYNAPTYYGMDIWALAAHIAYGPANTTMTAGAGSVLRALWDDVAAHYNSYLRNLSGPYDRAYTRDMNMHSAVLSLWWWGLWGREIGGQPLLGEADLLYDVAQGAALSLLMETVAKYVSPSTATALAATGQWTGSRLVTKTIRSSPNTATVRTATSWLSANVMVGAMSDASDAVNRGAQFVPAIVHWASDPARSPTPYVGFFSLYPSATTIEAVAGEGGSLTVAYPNATQDGSDIFTFAVSGIPPAWTIAGRRVEGLEELPCLRVNVSAPGLVRLPVTAATGTLEDHYYYNVSYVVPEGFVGMPSVNLRMEYTC
ncbi:unnamed protein product [Discula destructiva]